MTVQNATLRADYFGNGVTSTFAIPFYFFLQTDLLVILTDTTSGTPVVTPLVLNSDYTVTGGLNALTGLSGTGSISQLLGTSPNLPAVLTATQKLSILRNLSLTQLTHYVANSPFPAASHENALDLLTMQNQSLAEAQNRALTLPANTGSTSAVVPTPISGSVLGSVSGAFAWLSGASVTLAANLLTAATGMGTSLINYLAPWTGAVGRLLNLKLAETISVKDFGAKGDGVTDDTAAIQAAIVGLNARGGGTLYFPLGNYYIAYNTTVATWDCIFRLSSNTHIRMERGAKFSMNNSLNGYCGLFGVNWSAFPVSNISFTDCWFYQATPASLSGIQLNGPQNTTSPYNSISYVSINRCKFDGCGSAIYIVEQSNGTSGAVARGYQRTTQTVNINECQSINTQTFVNADGDNILISNCHAVGHPTLSYDAVTILCGCNVSVVGCDFSGFNNAGGLVIDVSDDSNNLLGPRHIQIIGNNIHDFACAQGIAVTSSNGTTFGVQDVVISGNSITNGTTAGAAAINVSSIAGFGMQDVVISSNNINSCYLGIQAISLGATPVYNLVVSNNSINLVNASGSPALNIQYASVASITGNVVFYGGPSTTYCLTRIGFCKYLTVSGNTFMSTATNSGGYLHEFGFTSPSTAQANTNFEFVGNTVYGTSAFSNMTGASKISANNFISNTTVNGNLLGVDGVDYMDGFSTKMGTAAPGSGTWNQGDKVINSNPAAGGSSYLGFICTTAGTPGTWKGYGLIQT